MAVQCSFIPTDVDLRVKKVHLAHFRANRFSIVFLNGARMFYLHKHMIEFLTKVCMGLQNKLLKSVLDDPNNELYISGCQALGLIDKFITGPLWKQLESNLHILDMSTHFTKLLEFVKECAEDATEFLTGERVPFPQIPINKDDVWASLVVPSPSDPRSCKSFKQFSNHWGYLSKECLRITFRVENGKVQVILSEDKPNRLQKQTRSASMILQNLIDC